MSMLLTMLMIYFGLVMLWAAPRLYRLLRTQWRAAMWCQTAAMPTSSKAAGE